MELQYCLKNAQAIFSRVNFVYNSTVIKKDPLVMKHCCDFKIFEKGLVQHIEAKKVSKTQEENDRGR